MARRAEEVGFASVWIPDHLIMDIPRPGSRPEGTWEAWSLVAARTPEEIAAGLRRYADAGFSQVQVWPQTLSVASVEVFAPVIEQVTV